MTRYLGTDQIVRPGGRPCALGLYDSVVLVLHLIRRNPARAVAAEFLDVSRSTVSRRWDLLRPIIGDVLTDLIPDPRQVVRGGTALVDGTVCPTWDWKEPGGPFSKKAGHPGMNVQIACDLDGEPAAIGPVPIPGARHDAHAYTASGPKALMDGIHQIADLGYLGVEGIDLVPIKRKPGQDLHEKAKDANRTLSSIRAAVERAVAHVKTWRMLSEEGGRFRPPIEKFPEMLAAAWGLINLKRRMIVTYE